MSLVHGGQTMLSPDRRPVRHIDPVLLTVTGLLSLVGLLMVYSATQRTLANAGFDPAFYLKRQITWVLLGGVLLLLASTFDYRFVKVYAPIFYGVTIFFLLLVRTPLGTDVKGSQRWFEILGFQFAPAEVMKLALIAMLAYYLSELRHQELTLQDVVRATALAAFPMLLVFLQPDLGTSMVLGAVLVGMLVVAGARLRYLAVLALTTILLALAALQLGVIKEYQVKRLTSFINPANDASGAGYNKIQSEIAIGAGGLDGRGYLKGTQTNLDFVPEQHTDFVFTVVGEEFGFFGTMLLITLFSILLWRALRISALSKDPFGTYLAAGIASMFAFQIFVNIGMTVGIMPVTGIPLPFVSYGGTSTLINYAAIGLLLNVHMRRFK